MSVGTSPVRVLQCSPPFVPRAACTQVTCGITCRGLKQLEPLRFLLGIDFKFEETCTETPVGLTKLQLLLMQSVKVGV